MPRNRKPLQARTADAADIDAVVALMRAGRVGGLLALDIYRLYRQYREFQGLLDLHAAAPKTAKPFIATTDGQLDLSTEVGQFVGGIIVLVGQMESANISRRVRDKIN